MRVLVKVLFIIAVGTLSVVLLTPSFINSSPQAAQGLVGGCPSGNPSEPYAVTFDSRYRVAPGNRSGSFQTGQAADMMLSGFGFNQSGGPLTFLRNTGIESDGTHLVLAERNNNRILIWNTPPSANTPPDLVLGQPDFNSNDSGSGMNQLNWPMSVATSGGRIIVADTNNDRILIWNSFPARSGAPADIQIRVAWPWGVWSNGSRLVATSAAGRFSCTSWGLPAGACAGAQIWNSFPVRNDQPPDLVLDGGGRFETPRPIISNNQMLIIGDENVGTFAWNRFPAQNTAPDYVLPRGWFWPELRSTGVVNMGAIYPTGEFFPDGRLTLRSNVLYLFNTAPQDINWRPDVSVVNPALFESTDGDDIAVAGERMYISAMRRNAVYVYDTPPTRMDQLPDWVLGGTSDVCANMAEANFIITNPAPTSNGTSLFVSSNIDSTLHVWKRIPDDSGARPDVVYRFPSLVSQHALWQNTLVVATGVYSNRVHIWTSLPLNGESPDFSFKDRIGSVVFQRITGVAFDGRYLYVSDSGANRVYIWEGLPLSDSEPKLALTVNQPGRLSTDGTWLVVAPYLGRAIEIFRVADFSGNPQPVQWPGNSGTYFNLARHGLVADGRLFVADTDAQRVLSWNRIEDAISGQPPNAILGNNLVGPSAQYGQKFKGVTTRTGLSSPAFLSFDGSYLWVGENKFSQRLLRYSLGGPDRTATTQINFSVVNRGGASLATEGTSRTTTTGYGRILPRSAGSAPPGMAIFGYRPGNYLVGETSVPATAAFRRGRLHAEINGPVSTALAVVNPNDEAATINFFYTDAEGTEAGSGAMTIEANSQIAEFLDSQRFKKFNGSSFQGTFTFTSNVPVSAIALRTVYNGRGDFLTSTLPVIDMAAAPNSGTVVIPHFAAGGGWTTLMLLINPTDSALTGTIEFRDDNGTVIDVPIADQTAKTYAVPPRSSQRLAAVANGAAIIAGSLRIIPTNGGVAPTPLVVFSNKTGDVTVSEAGVGPVRGTAFRMYAESTVTPLQSDNIQPGIAVTNNGPATARVTFEVFGLDGSATGLPGSVSLDVPGFGHFGKFLSDIFAVQPLPANFKGIVRISTTSPSEISVVGLRTRNNELGDFLITTLQPVNEIAPLTTDERFFPQLADGNGYTTQFILFSGGAGQSSTGSLRFFNPSGNSLNLTLR